VTELDEYAEHVLELLRPIGPVRARRMFGGVGIFYAATMFGLIADDELFFKIGDDNRADYEQAGQEVFTYETTRGTHALSSYWSCPPELLDDPDEFRRWARKSVDAALAAARAKTRRTTEAPRAQRRRKASR
jgi:DNA transformation protein and related proteins